MNNNFLTSINAFNALNPLWTARDFLHAENLNDHLTEHAHHYQETQRQGCSFVSRFISCTALVDQCVNALRPVHKNLMKNRSFLNSAAAATIGTATIYSLISPALILLKNATGNNAAKIAIEKVNQVFSKMAMFAATTIILVNTVAQATFPMIALQLGYVAIQSLATYVDQPKLHTVLHVSEAILKIKALSAATTLLNIGPYTTFLGLINIFMISSSSILKLISNWSYINTSNASSPIGRFAEELFEINADRPLVHHVRGRAQDFNVPPRAAAFHRPPPRLHRAPPARPAPRLHRAPPARPARQNRGIYFNNYTHFPSLPSLADVHRGFPLNCYVNEESKTTLALDWIQKGRYNDLSNLFSRALPRSFDWRGAANEIRSNDNLPWWFTECIVNGTFGFDWKNPRALLMAYLFGSQELLDLVENQLTSLEKDAIYRFVEEQLPHQNVILNNRALLYLPQENIEVPPANGNPDIMGLLRHFDQIAFRAPRFINRGNGSRVNIGGHYDPRDIKDTNVEHGPPPPYTIEGARSGLVRLLEGINYRIGGAGVPDNAEEKEIYYTTLTRKLQHLLNFAANPASDRTQVANILVDLCMAGKHCAKQWQDTINQQYGVNINQPGSGASELSTSEKVQSILFNRRHDLMPMLTEARGFEIHNLNASKKALKPYVAVARPDEGFSEGLGNIGYNNKVSDLLYRFYELYTPENIVDEVFEALKDANKFPPEELELWFKNNCTLQEVEYACNINDDFWDAASKDLIEDFDDETKKIQILKCISNEDGTHSFGRLNDPYNKKAIELMLFKMRVFNFLPNL